MKNTKNQVILRQHKLVEQLSFFDNWEDKYDYIISLGKQLPNFPEDQKVDRNLIKGCQSQVWFDYNLKQGKLNFLAASDALIVSGLISMLLRIYSDATPADIISSDTSFIKQVGLGENLSSTRKNGFRSMLEYIYAVASKNQ